MNVRTRFLTGTLALALTATACVSDDTANPSNTTGTDLSGNDIVLTSGRLQTVDSCDALLDRLIDEGVERVGPYGFGNGWYGPVVFVEFDTAEQALADDGASSPQTTEASTDSASGGGDFSGTNNQEVDVDEADLVKTDGDRLVVINGNKLQVIDVTGTSPELERTIQLDDETWATEMFLVGDRVLLMSQGWTNVSFHSGDAIGLSIPEGSQTSKLVEVDLNTGKIGQTIEFEGSYLSAREVDGSIRVVLSTGMGHFPFLYPSSPDAEEAAEKANRGLIEESTIDQWLPSYRITEGGRTLAEGSAIECDRMHLPQDFAGFGSLAVLTVNLDDGMELLDSMGVVTDGQTVYASTDRLTVATARWPEWDPETGEPEADEDYSTALHSFDITDLNSTSYVGSGEVTGHLLNQYSLSEHDGYLRVATTAGDPWWGGQNESESFVTVFDEVDDELEQVGQVGGLGEGERIFAVRFMGDTGFVVTFRQVDPLYTVDLSDPTNPVVVGELKIPGFSTYLHPVDPGLLLGVGQDATEEGQTTGSQVSLFDVSNLSDPQRVDQLGLGENSYSSVDWDPKSFLYWGADDLAVVPVSSWGWDEATQSESSSNAAVLIRIGENGTLTEVGRIGHPTTSECDGVIYEEDLLIEPATPSEDAEASFVEEPEPAIAVEPPQGEYCWNYQPEIRRSVVIDNQIFTVSEAGVRVNELDGLGDVAWISFSE